VWEAVSTTYADHKVRDRRHGEDELTQRRPPPANVVPLSALGRVPHRAAAGLMIMPPPLQILLQLGRRTGTRAIGLMRGTPHRRS
jgi:hypothetical protein